MKKGFFVCLLAVCLCLLWGCENATELRTVYFNEITSTGSENYGVRVTFASDSRLDGKGVDIQIKFSKIGTITLWQENQEKFDYQIADYDEWFSLTSIFSEENQEKFVTYENVVSKTYLFSSEEKIEVTLRAVAGDIQENAYKTGEILLDATPISNQFILKIK